MNKKLTLSIEESVIEKAKAYAKSKGRSLSDIIENYLKLVASENSKKSTTYNADITALIGTLKEPSIEDYKEDKTQRLIKKHLK